MKFMKPTNMAVGFYFTAASALLAVVSAVCYAAIFSVIHYKEPVFDVTISILLIAAAVVATVLLFTGKQFAGFSPAILCLSSGISFLMFVKMVIWPISDTIYGIEPFPQFTQLIICAVLFLVTFVVSEVALYMKKFKQSKQKKENAL
jgi:hypothetical protein